MRFLSANKIFDGAQFLPDTAVLALDNANNLAEIISTEEVEKGNLERLEGILTPGFVNSHCHLELSHLKGKIPEHLGLPEFARQVITLRNKFSPAEQEEHMQEADLYMRNSGIVAVGDISNSDISFRKKADSHLYYHTFLELIGLDPDKAGFVVEKGLEMFGKLGNYGLKGSLAPHAPYSTSRELIASIARHGQSRQLPFSIHNQESDEETNFFLGKKSGFEDLYRFLGLDISWFKAPRTSSLEHYADVLPSTPFLLVHNTVSKAGDIMAVASANAFWCFCPAANRYIESRLPDFGLFETQQHNICLGTDSLASNSSLDPIREANLLLETTSVFRLEVILRALTANGARALGISEKFGRLLPGKNAGLNLVGYNNNQLRFIKKIT